MSLRSTLVVTVARRLLLATLLVLSFLAVRGVMGDTYTEVVPFTAATAQPAGNDVRVELLMDRHGCWAADAPTGMQGVIPGHVVVSANGVTRLGGDRLVGQALEQTFDGVDHGLVVHGFCR